MNPPKCICLRGKGFKVNTKMGLNQITFADHEENFCPLSLYMKIWYESERRVNRINNEMSGERNITSSTYIDPYPR